MDDTPRKGNSQYKPAKDQRGKKSTNKRSGIKRSGNLKYALMPMSKRKQDA